VVRVFRRVACAQGMASPLQGWFLPLKKSPDISPHQSYTSRAADPRVLEKVHTEANKHPNPRNPWERELFIRKATQEKTKKMEAQAKEYHKKLKEIAKKQSDIKVVDELPDINVRIQEKTQSGLKKLAASDGEYKSWLRQRVASQDQRIQQVMTDRTAAMRDHRKKLKAREMELQSRRGPGALHSKSASQIDAPRIKKSLHFTDEELQEYRKRWQNPIWNQSLDERAGAEKEYWKWSRNLRDTAVCAVDHKFTGPWGNGQTDVRRALIESAEREKQYWKWAGEVKGNQKCSIDQSWADFLEAEDSDVEEDSSAESSEG